MQTNLMTIGAMAEKLSASDGVNSAGYIARQIRTFVQRGVLQPVTYKGEGATAAAMFDEAGLCEARIFTVLARLNISLEIMKNVRGLFQNMDGAEWTARAGKGVFRPGLHAAIDGMKKDEEWFFVISIGNPHLEEYEGEFISGYFSKSPKFDCNITNVTSVASIVLPLRSIFRGLIVGEDA